MKTMVLMAVVGTVMLGGVRAENREWQAGLEERTLEKGPHELPYRLGTVGEGKALPLVVFLHGAGERGNDNAAQLTHGVKDLMAWCEENKQGCHILVPQCGRDGWWSNLEGNFKDPGAVKMGPEPAWALAMVFDVVDGLVKTGVVDPRRIYITGLSMGGYGSFDAISRRPDFFAAAMPVCGGGDPAQAEKIKNVPLWVFHGGKDGTVPPEMSRAMVEAVKKAGGSPRYREYPEAGHDSWSATYSDPEVWKWLFAQKRGGE